MVNGLETPKAGKTPDYTATVAYPEWYQLDPIYAGTNGIVWSDGLLVILILHTFKAEVL